jgi:hypothetical protein
MNIEDTCKHTKIRLIAAAIAHQQCTRTAGTEVQIPGTDKRILIGNDEYLAKVATPATEPLQAAPAGIDLDQLNRIERAASMFRDICAFHPGHFQQLKNFANDALELAALARRAAADAPAAPLDVKYEFEKWASNRGEAAIYIGDGLYQSGAITDQAEAFAAGVALARAALAHPIGQVSPAIDRAAAPTAGTPRVDALMAKWDDDGAARGSAFIELRDLARELEREACQPPAPVCHAPAADMRECPDCEGSAKISANEWCKRCDASGIVPDRAPEAAPVLLAEILALAESGMCQGLVADDYCSQIVAKIKAAPEAAHAQQDASQPDGDPWTLGFEAGKRVGAQLAAVSPSDATGKAGAASAGGVATILQAAGAMRMVRCHDGSGEPFAAYDKDIADRVVAGLRAEMHALTGATSAADAKDAERWRETLKHVGAAADPQRFVFRGLSPAKGADLMRGSVAQHFTETIDAAIAASRQGEAS